MKKHLLSLAVAAAAWVFAGTAAGQPAPDQRALELVRKIDELYRSKSSYALVEMEILTPDWQRTLVLKAWSLGLDKTLIRILEPKKEAGVGTLRIGNEMWNYLPNTDKIIKIPPSMMMSSWMGSDFTNDDLVKEFTFVSDFTFRMVTPDGAQPGLVYVECRPKPGVPIVWDKIVIAVRESDTLPVWQEYYDEKGRVARRLDYSEVKTFGRRTIPSVMEMVPQTKQGYKTVLRYRDVRFDLPLEDSVFSLRSLQSAK
jgi:outer membrane lipoprotein-sorting protein